MGGQLEGLISLSRRPGQQVLIVFDPYWNDPSDTVMDPGAELRVQVIRKGRVQPEFTTTIGRLAATVFQWQWNEGALADPDLDKEKPAA